MNMTPAKTATVQARMSPALKKSAERIFRRHNMTAPQAITLFFRQLKTQGGVPFGDAPGDFSAYTKPNRKTLEVLRDSNAGRGVVSYDSVEDMIRDLETDKNRQRTALKPARGDDDDLIECKNAEDMFRKLGI